MERKTSGQVETRSILSQVVEADVLPPEFFGRKIEGEAVEIKKNLNRISVLRKIAGHYSALQFDGRGFVGEIDLDFNTHQINAAIDREQNLSPYLSRGKPKDVFKGLGYSQAASMSLEQRWFEWAKSRYTSYSTMEPGDIRKSGKEYFPLGRWESGTINVQWEQDGKKQTQDTFYYKCGDQYFCAKFEGDRVARSGLDAKGEDPRKITLQQQDGTPLILSREDGLVAFYDEKGKVLTTFSGNSPEIDPLDPSRIFFINTGKIYSLDINGVKKRTSRPQLEAQIEVESPRELALERQGNFMVVKSGEDKLVVVDRETGDKIREFEGVKGPFCVDETGDIVYVDGENQLRYIQTNFQAIPRGGTEAAKKKRDEQLALQKERFEKLQLRKGKTTSPDTLTEETVAQTLRRTLAREVSERIQDSVDLHTLEDVVDRLSEVRSDPANTGYEGVVDEFIAEARGKINKIALGDLEDSINRISSRILGVKSVGDTIGLDEELAGLIKLRQKVDIGDVGKRKEVEERIRNLGEEKEGIIVQYQGELTKAAEDTLGEIKDLVGEMGSGQELANFQNSTDVANFEMMIANIRDPKVRRELRAKFNTALSERRTFFAQEGMKLEEEQRMRWAEVVEEAREDLESLKDQIGALVDSKEIDRFSRHPLVTAWRAKILALPVELREAEEKKLEVILNSRKIDIEHRKELGTVGAEGELKFGKARFPVYKEPPRLWQPKLKEVKGGMFAELVFEDSQGKVFKPQGEERLVVSPSEDDEKTKRLIEEYKGKADEFFRGIKRKVPEFDEHWRITDFHMSKLEEIAEALNLQLDNHRGILILQGEAGTGKNVLVDILANLSNREVIQVLCNENSVKEDLTYEFYYDPEKGTYKLPSKLVEGIQTPGAVVLFDEINALKPGIAKMLNSLFDYRRKIVLPEGGGQQEIITEPSVIFIGTMNPQNYAGVNRLSPEVKSRARVVDVPYPPFEESRGGRTYWRSDEGEMLAAYMDEIRELKQKEFRLCWDYVINSDRTNGADTIISGDPTIEKDIRRIHDVVRTANRLREMYEAYQIGDSNEPMDFPTSLREVTDIVMEMNHKEGVKPIMKRVIIPKIDDRRQKRMVDQTIEAVLPE